MAIAASVSLCAVPAFGADAPASGGTLTLGDKTYNLSKFVAYELKSDDETLIAVVASDRNLPIQKIQAALREGDGKDDDLFLTQPHVKVVYNQEGKAQYVQAWAENTSMSTGGDRLAGKFALKNGRAVGQVIQPERGEGALKSRFSFQFDVPLGLESLANAPKADRLVKPSVSGTYKGNGKPAKLAFVSAARREPFGDKPAFVLIMTEKDHTRDRRAETAANFGDYGSALILSFSDDGSIFGCQVAHDAHPKKPFSAIGRIRMSEFELGGNFVVGKVTTDGEDETFGQTWEVDLQFASPLPPDKSKPASGATADNKPKEKMSKPAATPPAATSPAEQPAAPAIPQAKLSIRALPLPKDATDVVYKEIVEQITFKSGAKVQALAGEFSKQLALQGWTKEPGELVNATSAIMRRRHGKASLTIMVKPDGAGSQATIFSEGMDWSEK